MADDDEMIQRVQTEADASVAAGQPYRNMVILSDGSAYGETVTVNEFMGSVPRPEWMNVFFEDNQNG